MAMIAPKLIIPILATGFMVNWLSPSGLQRTLKYVDSEVGLPLVQSSRAAKVPRARIGMNVPALRSYGRIVAFQNLAYGDDWKDEKWAFLPPEQRTADGGVLYTVPGHGINHFLSIPSAMPPGTRITCTFKGSGKLGVAANGRLVSQKPGATLFEMTASPGGQAAVWLTLRDVSRDRPFENLDCRQNSAEKAQFRPEFVKTIAGYSVVRFMDWQNSNANSPVTWATRHPAGDSRFSNDGVAIEDMMAFANAVKASPWFVMPWNADDSYVAGFAKYVAEHLPADQTVYVEVGNEVWNGGFAVAQQAKQEGLQAKLADRPLEARLLRYAQHTVQDMKIWEAAFKGRKGLVRVVSSQHFRPLSAGTILAAPEIAEHTDALATAPYFGRMMGGPVTRAAVISDLTVQLKETERLGLENKAIAQKYGKRYIAYEGGQGLAVPADRELFREVENSPEMYGFYKSYLQWWKRDIGDTLCLLTSTASIGPGGAWGLTEFEEDGPDKSVKLKAVLEER